MEDINIKINRENRTVIANKYCIGNDGENLQGNIVFSFDEFVNGQARLEYVIKGAKAYQMLEKDEETYKIPIKKVLTKEGTIDMQLVITIGTDETETSVFKSNIFSMFCDRSINSEIEQPDEYLTWIEVANTKLNEIDEALTEINEIKDYATEQADYAKETSDTLNLKLEKGELDGATFVPNLDEEGNLSWSNNKNLENPQTQNIRGPQGVMGPQGEAFKIKKTYSSKEEMLADFENMEIGDYVMITSNIEVEDNAKLYSKGETEWVFITDFSGATGIQGPQGIQGIQGIQGVQGPKGDKPVKGVDYFTEAEQNEMVSEITDDANSVFNQNVAEKTNEFNTNAEAKVNEFNETVDSLQEEIDDLYNNQLFSEASGESIHITDSANAKVSHLEIEGNSYQKTTTGKQLFNFKDYDTNNLIINEDDWLSGEFDNTNGTGTGSTFLNYFIRPSKLLKPNTKYKLILEIKDFSFVDDSTEGRASLNLGNTLYSENPITQIKENIILKIKDLKKTTYVYDITTVDDVDNKELFLRNFVTVPVGTKVSITFRLSVIEDTTITENTFVYEPFSNGIVAPNPDYPQEIEVVEAYNLFDKRTSKDGYYYNDAGTQMWEASSFVSDYISVENGSYMVIGNDTTSVLRICTYDKNKTFIRRITTSGQTFLGIQITENEKYVIVSSNKLSVKESMMFIKGTTLKPYLPYNNIKLTIKNSNLFLISDFSLGGMDYGNIDTSKKYRINNVGSPIPVEPSKDYIINVNSFGAFMGLRVGIHTCAKDGSFVHDSGWINLKNNTPYRFKTRPDAKYLKMLFSGSLTDEEVVSFSNEDTTAYTSPKEWLRGVEIKIEQNKEVTPYELSKQNISYIDLQGNFLGKLPDGTKDRLYIENNHLYLEKKIKKRILDGSEDWSLQNNAFVYEQSDALKVFYGDDKIRVISDFFKGRISEFRGQFNNLEIGKVIDNNRNQIGIKYTDILTVEEFKAWLSENNVTVYYELAEPQIIDLGYIKTPKTFEKTSNISLLANLETNMSLEYVQHTKTILDNIQNQINSIMTSIIPLDGEVE